MTDQQAEVPPVPGVARWRPKQVIVEARQWHRNGDHPADNCQVIKPDPDSTTQFAPFLSEGEIVRYYRNPDDPGTRWCGDCGSRMHDHGWIDQGTFGRVVCPADWVVSLPLTTPGLTAHFPVAADVFAATYEPAGSPQDPEGGPAPAREDTAEAVSAAIEAAWWSEGGPSSERVMAVVWPMLEGQRERAEAAEARLAELENAVTWNTSCTSCARVLDSSVAEHERAERAEAKVAAITEQARSWAGSAAANEWSGTLLSTTVLADAGRTILAFIGSEGNEPAGESLTPAQCDRLRSMVTEYGDALSAVGRGLDLAGAQARTGEDADVIKAAREALKVLEGSEEEAGRG